MSNKREVMYRGRLIKVSEHAKFLATDETGDIFEYSLKPKPHDILPMWDVNGGDFNWRCVFDANDYVNCNDWQDSLFEIGEEERGND